MADAAALPRHSHQVVERLKSTVNWVALRTGPTGVGLILALIVELVVFSLASPFFLNGSNLANVGRAMAIIGIGCVGMTIVIISGGFDLSVGSVMAASGMFAAFLINGGAPVALGLVGAVGLGLLLGLLNGVVIAYLRINPLIATLATLSIIRGVAYLISSGNAIVVSDPGLLAIGTDDVLGVPLVVVVLLSLFGVVGFLMPRTRFGRYTYAIGSSARASRLSGVPVARWMLVFYALCAATAALAGFIAVARTGAAEPSANIGAELDMITAVILGGASLSGGRGKLLGTLLALTVLAVLANGLILMGVPSYWQLPIKGMVLLAAIIWGEVRQASRDQT